MKMTNSTRLFGQLPLHKLLSPCLTAMALMLCAALPAHAQATKSKVALMVTTPDMNMYSCEITLVTTPSGNTNGECTATIMMGNYTVTHALRSDDMAMELMEMGSMIMWMPMGMVNVEELPGGTAMVTFHRPN